MSSPVKVRALLALGVGALLWSLAGPALARDVQSSHVGAKEPARALTAWRPTIGPYAQEVWATQNAVTQSEVTGEAYHA